MSSATCISKIHSIINKILRVNSIIWNFKTIAIHHIVSIGCIRKKTITFFENVIRRYLCILHPVLQEGTCYMFAISCKNINIVILYSSTYI